MTFLNLSADEVLTTTRSVRKRLDFDRPVERSVIEDCLNIAMQAPTGSNMQGWQWVIVEDADKKKAIADVYRAGWDKYSKFEGPAYGEGDTRGERQGKVVDSATYLAENLERAPLFLIPCLQGRLDNLPVVGGAGMWGSLLPAVWSFMLAARNRGLGSAWTTLHLMGDGEQKTAEILGIPFAEYTQGALLPIAYTIGTEFKLAKREPLANVLHWDSW